MTMKSELKNGAIISDSLELTSSSTASSQTTHHLHKLAAWHLHRNITQYCK